ncbi:MAG TPA: TPM domain-containing protein [Chryseolinea sp.]
MTPKLLYSILFLLALLTQTSCGTSGVQSKIEGRAMDGADLLTDEEETVLAQISQDLERKVGSQLVIITIDSLFGVAIEEYSLRKASEMGLGRKYYDDGVLITVVHRNREMRIEVGSGLEQILTNEKSAQIVRELMAPRFREQKFFEGLQAAADTIAMLIEDHKELLKKRP